MKEAEVNDAFRRIQSKRLAWKGSLSKLEIKSYLGLSGLVIDFPLAVSALVGCNGSGKSRILSSIASIVDDPNNAGLVAHYDGARSGDLGVVQICAAEKTELYKRYFNSIEDIAENLLNGVGSYLLDGDELSEVNYILCRSYHSVTFFETEPGLRLADAGADTVSFSSDVIPFFQVSGPDGSWDTRSMGAGEYAALFIWWSLRNCKAGQMVLLEEPETFLSYVVQERLSNYLSKAAWDKKLNVFISTHSFPFIARLPEDGIRALLRSKNGSRLATRGKVDILAHIGAPISIKFLCVVEDSAAKFFVDFFLDFRFPALRPAVAVRFAGGGGAKPKKGESGVVGFLNEYKNIVDFPLQVVGLFDGDLRDNPTVASLSGENPQVDFLPGFEPIDKVFTEICRERLEETEVVHSQFREAFEYHEGANFHDHLRLACTTVGINIEVIWRFCCRVWLERDPVIVENFSKVVDKVFRTD